MEKLRVSGMLDFYSMFMLIAFASVNERIRRSVAHWTGSPIPINQKQADRNMF